MSNFEGVKFVKFRSAGDFVAIPENFKAARALRLEPIWVSATAELFASLKKHNATIYQTGCAYGGIGRHATLRW